MLRIIGDDDGNTVIVADADGCDYLIEGLERLKDEDPGQQLTTPSLDTDRETGAPQGVSEFLLKRAAD